MRMLMFTLNTAKDTKALVYIQLSKLACSAYIIYSGNEIVQVKFARTRQVRFTLEKACFFFTIINDETTTFSEK